MLDLPEQPRRMARAGRNAKEIMVPKIEVTGLGDYTRNVGYKTGSITYEFETKTFNYDHGIKLLPDVIDVDEAGVLSRGVDKLYLGSLRLIYSRNEPSVLTNSLFR